jgi:hypothetical protein
MFRSWATGIKRGLVALAVAMATPAPATIIQQSFQFEAATGGPTAFHSGTFAFAYDSATGEAALTLIDFAIGQTPFSLFNASVAPHGFDPSRPQFILGGMYPGRPENVIEHGTDDFWLVFRPDVATASQFAYSQAGADLHSTWQIGLRVPTAQVPAPGAWALFLLGAGLLAGRRRRYRISSSSSMVSPSSRPSVS